MLEVDDTLADGKLHSIGGVLHQQWLIKDARHLRGVTQGIVDALHHRVEVVDAHGEVIGVGEHHHKRAGTDAKPRIATGREHRRYGHNACYHRAGGKPARKHRLHRG